MALREEIPPPQWQVFLEQFSREHEGWLASLEVDGATAAGEAPLNGVAGGAGGIEVRLGSATDPYTEPIEGPLRVWFEVTDNGAHAGLQIETVEHKHYRLRFRVPAHPELLDGIAGMEAW